MAFNKLKELYGLYNIDKPSDYFKLYFYTGNGSNGHAIYWFRFSTRLGLVKERNTTNTHEAFDSVRGATKTFIQIDQIRICKSTGSLTSFNSDGFTVGSGDVQIKVEVV